MSTLQTASQAPHRPWRGVDASERIARRSEKLIDAALETIARNGYAKATVQGICKEAGLTQRYFYESFGDKEELLAVLLDRIGAGALAATQLGIGEVDRPVVELSHDALDALFGYLLDDPRRAQVLLVESVGVSPRIEALRRAHFAHFQDLLREVGIAALGDAAPPLEDAELTARALFGGVIELLVAYVRGELPVGRDRLAAHLVEMFEATAPIQSGGTA